MQVNHTLTSLALSFNNIGVEGTSVADEALKAACVVVQRNAAFRSLHVLLEADVARLWSLASSASASPPARPPAVWSAFFGHPRLFERHVVGLVATFAGERAYVSSVPHVM